MVVALVTVACLSSGSALGLRLNVECCSSGNYSAHTTKVLRHSEWEQVKSGWLAVRICSSSYCRLVVIFED